jgi:IS30 family transposase
MGKLYHQLTWNDRLKIEARINIGYKPQRIADELGVHVSTIYRELKRGTYEHLN